MSPVVIRNRMRTRSVSRADAEGGLTKKSFVRHDQRPRRRSHVEEDNMMTKRELARTIAEFRVGLSTGMKGSNEGIVADMDVSVDTPKHNDEPSPVHDRFPIQPSIVKDKIYEPTSETPQENHTQSPTTNQHNAEKTLQDNNGSASLEDPPSRPGGSHRRGFTSSERELLEAAFHISDNPGSATMKLLVHLTGLDKKKIRGWFRTRRLRQEREEAKGASSENTPPSMTEPKYQVPPQYWPEPLRFSHMQQPYPGYNYRAPTRLPAMPSEVPFITPGIPSLTSKVPSACLYPPIAPTGAPAIGFLPAPPPPLPSQWYPPLGFSTGLSSQPTITKDGPSSVLPPASQATSTMGMCEAPNGPLYRSLSSGHPPQGVIPPAVPTPSGMLPRGFLHPWSSLGYYAPPGLTPQHPGVTPCPQHPAMPYYNPWYPMLPTQNPAKAETSMVNTSSTLQSIKTLPSQVACTIQEIPETESETSSTI